MAALPKYVMRTFNPRTGHVFYYCYVGTKANGRRKLYRLPDLEDPLFRAEYRKAMAERDGVAPAVRPPPPESRVYFIGADEGPIKIGHARNIWSRLQCLQAAAPPPIELKVLATRPGARPLEQQYHSRFASYRLRGEWFERAPEILAEIEALKSFGLGNGVPPRKIKRFRRRNAAGVLEYPNGRKYEWVQK